MRKQLAARQVDASVREDVAVQKERLKYLEAQLEAMQRQTQQAPGRRTISPTRAISAADVQMVRAEAAQGYGMAQTMLGRLYELGNGVPQDYVQARQWYEQAAAQGLARAQEDLGALYFMGRGVPQDYATARQWFEKAAAQGYAGAQFFLGSLYEKGQGVPQDYAQARQWYEQAAAQGYDPAQYHLGSLYDKGEGTPQDYAQARQWYEKAATQGNPFAQMLLGMKFFLGEHGIAKDYVLSYMWCSLAVQGDAQLREDFVAQETLEMLERRMTPQQLQEARRLARDWRAKKENTP